MKNDELVEIFDCLDTRPFAEDDALLNDYIDRVMHYVSWDLFRHQEDVCHMISEKNPPMLKDNIIEYMSSVVNRELGWLRGYIMARILITYRLSNVDLGEEGEWWLRDRMGDESYFDFEKAARKFIYKDYAKFLGEEKADEYFRKIGREDYILKED
jgi:hypothetical protein